MKHQPPYPQDIDLTEPDSPEESDKATMLGLQNEMTYLTPSGQRAAAVLALGLYDQTDPYPFIEITLNDHEYILQATFELIQQLSPNARAEFVRWLLNQESVWADIGIAEAVTTETVTTEIAAEEISTGTRAQNPDDFDPIPF